MTLVNYLVEYLFRFYSASNVCYMTVAETINHRLADLTPAERKVAAVVADDPEAVAFGTVADVAARAGTSGPSVVRLAAKLGYDGFVDLQAAVQDEIARRLRPASERIRQPPAGDAVARTLAVELENVAATLSNVDRTAFDRAVRLLIGRGGRVLILSGEASHGAAVLLAAELSMLRPGVELLAGSEVRVAGALAEVGRSDTLVVIDLSRYDRWVVQTAERAAGRGARLVVLTDSALSPLAVPGAVSFTVSAAGAGPFDSHTGVLALGNALVAAVAARLRRSATERLDRIEAAWRETGALLDG